jgi:DNA-binding transcriptional LysR family regulator
VLASADGAVANMQRSLRSEVGTLTVGVFARGTGPFFSAIIKEFKRRFQDVQVSLVEITTAAAQHRLVRVVPARASYPTECERGHSIRQAERGLRGHKYSGEPVNC